MVTRVVHISASMIRKGYFRRYSYTLSQLPSRMVRYGTDNHLSMAKRIVKKARGRAPFWSGYLKNSIDLDKKNIKPGPRGNVFKITATAPYSAAQEQGYSTHFVPAYNWTRIPKRGGFARVRDWMNKKHISRYSSGISASRNKTFMLPAVINVYNAYQKAMKYKSAMVVDRVSFGAIPRTRFGSTFFSRLGW